MTIRGKRIGSRGKTRARQPKGLKITVMPGAIDPKTAANVFAALGIVMKPQEDNLIALLDQGKVDEFRRRMNANKLERRKTMFSRVVRGE